MPSGSTERHGGLWAAWAVLIGTGGTSVTFNVWHSVHAGELEIVLAVLAGLAPVFTAACVSHLVAAHRGGWFMRAVAFAVMLGAMALSISATAAVVAPAAGHMRWVYGAVLDAAALLALWAILDTKDRDRADADAVSDAERRAVLARSEAESLRAELGSATAELDRVRTAAAAVAVPVPTRGPARRSRTAPKRARTAPKDDLALEARALNFLAADLDMTGAELARRLGVTEGYGRKLKRKLTDPDRPKGDAGPGGMQAVKPTGTEG